MHILGNCAALVQNKLIHLGEYLAPVPRLEYIGSIPVVYGIDQHTTVNRYTIIVKEAQ